MNKFEFDENDFASMLKLSKQQIPTLGLDELIMVRIKKEKLYKTNFQRDIIASKIFFVLGVIVFLFGNSILTQSPQFFTAISVENFKLLFYTTFIFLSLFQIDYFLTSIKHHKSLHYKQTE